MLFSAYQIESLLADFQQTGSPAGKFASETLSLSADAIQDARKYLRPLKRSHLNWVTPKDIRGLVEDISFYDPVVDNVQQSRAGRFVVPAYVPEVPAPAFPLVRDHTKMAPESKTTEQESSKSTVTDENAMTPEVNTESADVEDKVSVSGSEDISKENSLLIETRKVLKNQKNLPLANRQFLLLHYLKVLMMKNMNLKKKDYKETIVRKTMSSLEMAALIKNP